MSTLALEVQRLEDLRHRALTRLVPTGQTSGARGTASAALSALHELASSPVTAAEALAVLHELQVHQVELELQAEELRHARLELEATLARQIALFEHAPFSYFIVDAALRMVETNQAGVRLLGGERDALIGCDLTSFLQAESVPVLRQLLAKAGDSISSSAVTARLSLVGSLRTLFASVTRDPLSSRFLVTLVEIDLAG